MHLICYCVTGSAPELHWWKNLTHSRLLNMTALQIFRCYTKQQADMVRPHPDYSKKGKFSKWLCTSELRHSSNKCREVTVLKPCKIHPSTIWSPCHKNHIQFIEAVQRRAARFAVNCYSRYQSVTDN